MRCTDVSVLLDRRVKWALSGTGGDNLARFVSLTMPPIERTVQQLRTARVSERERFICNLKQEAFEKCWAHSPLRAVLHCHSPGVATRHLRINVYNDDNDNA